MTQIDSPIAAAVEAPVAVAPASVPDAPANPMALDDAALAARYGVTDTSAPEPEIVFGTDAEAAAAEPVVASPEPAPEPEAPAPEPITAPITPFAVFDAEGEVEIPTLLLSFKAGGKEYEKVPLDRVVRMAQSAPLAEKFRVDAERVPVLEQTVQQERTSREQVLSELQANNAMYERILSDPDLYVRAVEAYQQQQSPEARADRAERERDALQTQQQENTQREVAQRTLAEASAFTEQRIAPAIGVLVQHYAGVIEPEEFVDRFHTLTADLMAVGPAGKPWVPPAMLPEVERRVQTDLAAWAKERADKRTSSRAAVTQQATTQVQKAQADAQQAKRLLSRAALPARTAPAPDVPRSPTIVTSADAVEASLAKVRAHAAQASR